VISRIKRALGGHVPESDLSALADGELRGGAAAHAARHIEGCDRCRSELEGLRMLKAMLAQAPRAQPTRSFVLSGAEAPSPAMGRAWPAFAWAPAAALAALVLLLAVDLSGVAQGGKAVSRDSGAAAPVAENKAGVPGTLAAPRVAADAGAVPSQAAGPSAFGAAPGGTPPAATPLAAAPAAQAPEAQPLPASTGSHGSGSVLRYLEILTALVLAGSLAYVVWRRSRDVRPPLNGRSST
jgi:anti-sigma factor RsiW